ncbi:MAG: FAD-dependent oxidoreductase [Lachnospiraceae bacterium]|nr:FAD-dependent oxidoreductase [Lachnospiraceae bacterium]
MTRGDGMESIWSKERPRILTDNRPLPNRAEVVIIGGGMAGLLCAYLLKEAGVAPIVLEADVVCSGQTGNTTAKITSQHELIYDELTTTFGTTTASQYGSINQKTIDEYERIIKEKRMDCEFRRLPAYLYTKTEDGARTLEMERVAAKKAGISASIVYETDLPFSVKMALKYDRQAQFHPLKFLSGIVPELEIYEHTRVLRVNGQEAVTEKGTVTADHVVMATHFPFVNFPGFYFARMHQERSYVLALEAKQPDGATVQLDGMYYGIDSDGLSFRSAGNQILLGGGSHRTGKVQKENPYDALRREAAALWPGYRETARWAAQDCMTIDKLPYIGRFSKSRPNWYVATGFGKWGMTNSMIAAMAIRDMILGRTDPDWQCVSPERKLTKKAVGTLMKEAAATTKNFLTPERPRCPHLGCRLVWNPHEKSWDCPCHGSRFAEDGGIIDNPAQKNKSV